jgi:hypothetical protein
MPSLCIAPYTYIMAMSASFATSGRSSRLKLVVLYQCSAPFGL